MAQRLLPTAVNRYDTPATSRRMNQPRQGTPSLALREPAGRVYLRRAERREAIP